MSNDFKTPLISVIIPVFNREKLIKRAIYSVLTQTYKNLELILIDDGSKDKTKSIILNCSLLDTRIKYYFFQKNIGPNVCRNKGIELAQGKFIAFLDSDDVWYPNKLEEQIKVFLGSTDAKLGIVYCWLVKNSDRKLKTFKTSKKSGDVRKEILMGNFVGGASVVLIKSDVFEKCGQFDENNCLKQGGSQDYELWIRISQKYHFNFVPKFLVVYYVLKNSISLITEHQKPLYRLKAKLYVWKKYKTHFLKYPKAYSSRIISIGPSLIKLNKIYILQKYLISGIQKSPLNFSLYFNLFLLNLIDRFPKFILAWNFPNLIWYFIKQISYIFYLNYNH